MAAVWNIPKFVHSSKFVEGAVNGWQLSTYTTYSSGAPLQPNMGGNLNAQFGGLSYPTHGAPDMPDNTLTLPNGLKSSQINSGTWYGTDQNGGGYVVIVPQVTCDPRHHSSGTYFNASCFSLPNASLRYFTRTASRAVRSAMCAALPHVPFVNRSLD